VRPYPEVYPPAALRLIFEIDVQIYHRRISPERTLETTQIEIFYVFFAL
jgi:hypothetical protein